MTTGTDRAPCSDQSLQRQEPMYGTASAGSTWLMLELGGSWGHSAFLNSPGILDPQLGRAIVRRAEAAGTRVAAIRRHGRRPGAVRWRWFVAHSRPGEEALHHGEVSDPREYLDLALDGSDGPQVRGPLVAICAHGKHDQCCAVRGRRATAAIAAEYPEFTWECSHLGGDRFAATLLVLPEGLCYGRVDTAADPAELVRLYLDGRVENRLLRGRTSLPHAVQAAQYFAREATGADHIDAFTPADVDIDVDQVRVVLKGKANDIEVVLQKQFSEPLFSQCSAQVAGRVRTFGLVSLRTS